MANLKVHLRFPEERITEPIIYQIGKDYRVITNIRRADVTERTGWVDLELIGDSEEIERVMNHLKDRGVEVDPIERNIIE